MAGCWMTGIDVLKEKEKVFSSEAQSFFVFPLVAQSSKGGEKDRWADA